MKDRTCEHHSPILTQAILSSRKTPNQAGNIRENTPRKTTVINHLIDHLINLNNHINHLNHRTELQDLLQCWQNNSGVFCKHCRKLEVNPDSRAEVLHSSSVLLTGIQVQSVSILVLLMSCQVSCQPNPCNACTSSEVSRTPQLLFFHQNH